MKLFLNILSVCVAVASVVACAPTVRRSGQIEAFEVTGDGSPGPGTLAYPQYAFNPQKVTPEQARIGENSRFDPLIGDLVRFTDDTVTLAVPQVYLHHLPSTLSSSFTGRYDAMLFAETWENAATDRSSPPLNKIVYVALDQRVPGVLNFTNSIAYGPTTFKGHPLRVKFTLVLLQRRAKESADTAAKTVQDVVSVAAAGSPAAAISSTVIGLLRQLIKSLPDVEAFDFEATFLPYRPPEAISASSPLAQSSLASKLRDTATTTSFDAGANKALADQATEALNANLAAEFEPVTMAIASLGKTRPEDVPILVSKIEETPAYQFLEELDTTKLSALKNSMSALKDGKGPQPERVGDAIAAAETAKKDAVENRKKSFFRDLQNNIIALSAATDADKTKAAAKAILTSEGYAAIELPDGWEKEINARPWLRYGMYALVETARYNGNTSDPILLDALGASLLNGKLVLKDPALEGTNYLLVDVIPGQVAVDERILQTASEAAQNLLNAVGYTPTRQLIENPSKLTSKLDEARSDLLESVVRIKGEALARDLAREVNAGKNKPTDNQSKKAIFVENGPFVKAWTERVVASIPAADKATPEQLQRWAQVGDSIRVQFLRRFSSGS